MTIPETTFVDLCLQGEALIDEIDEYVQRWHEGGDDRTLPEFLGLTESEYALWVEKPFSLKLIIFAKKNETPIDQLLSFSEGYAMAARASSPDEVNVLVDWLRKTKRLPS